MADSNVVPLQLDETNPRQIYMAAMATLERAERVRQYVTELRDDHRIWYRKIQEDEQGRIDAIVREAAEKTLPQVMEQMIRTNVRAQLVRDLLDDCRAEFGDWIEDHIMGSSEFREFKRIAKTLRALVEILGSESRLKAMLAAARKGK